MIGNKVNRRGGYRHDVTGDPLEPFPIRLVADDTTPIIDADKKGAAPGCRERRSVGRQLRSVRGDLRLELDLWALSYGERILDDLDTRIDYRLRPMPGLVN